MSKVSERLLQVAAAVVIAFYGYNIVATFAVDTFITKYNLAQCQKTLGESKNAQPSR